MQYKALAIYTIIPTNDHFVPILEVSADPSNDGNSKSQMSSGCHDCSPTESCADLSRAD